MNALLYVSLSHDYFLVQMSVRAPGYILTSSEKKNKLFSQAIMQQIRVEQGHQLFIIIYHKLFNLLHIKNK